jgi:hypothetical protein
MSTNRQVIPLVGFVGPSLVSRSAIADLCTFGKFDWPILGGTDPVEDPRVSGSDLGPDHGSAEVVCPPAELAPRIRVSK